MCVIVHQWLAGNVSFSPINRPKRSVPTRAASSSSVSLHPLSTFQYHDVSYLHASNTSTDISTQCFSAHCHLFALLECALPRKFSVSVNHYNNVSVHHSITKSHLQHYHQLHRYYRHHLYRPRHHAGTHSSGTSASSSSAVPDAWISFLEGSARMGAAGLAEAGRTGKMTAQTETVMRTNLQDLATVFFEGSSKVQSKLC